MSISRALIASALSTILLVGQVGPAPAAPLPTHIAAMTSMAPSGLTQVYWRGGWAGGWGVGAGLLAGALIGGAIASGGYGYYGAPYYAYGYPTYPYYGYYGPRAAYYGGPYYGYGRYYRPHYVYRHRWYGPYRYW